MSQSHWVDLLSCTKFTFYTKTSFTYNAHCSSKDIYNGQIWGNNVDVSYVLTAEHPCNLLVDCIGVGSNYIAKVRFQNLHMGVEWIFAEVLCGVGSVPTCYRSNTLDVISFTVFSNVPGTCVSSTTCSMQNASTTCACDNMCLGQNTDAGSTLASLSLCIL